MTGAVNKPNTSEGAIDRAKFWGDAAKKSKVEAVAWAIFAIISFTCAMLAGTYLMPICLILATPVVLLITAIFISTLILAVSSKFEADEEEANARNCLNSANIKIN